jgi:hypothetical protein
MYYTRIADMFLCVVTAPSHGGDRFVVTAYFTRNIKEGKELWKR